MCAIFSPTAPELLLPILDQSPDAIAKIDRHWKVVYLNSRAREMLAASGDVLGKNHWESFPSSNFEGSPWLYHYYRAMDEGIEGEFEHYYPAPLNRWLRITVRPLADGIVVFFRDVTESVAAKADKTRVGDALRGSEARLRIAVDTAKLGTWELDLASGVMQCSARCKRNFGRAPVDRFDYADLLTSIQVDDLPAMQEAVRAAIENRVDYRAEYRVVWPDGSLHWVVASGRASYSPDGLPVRMVGVTMDVTERHLSMQALMQTEKLAAVGRLASSIAHEINNPLEAVTNLLFLAKHSDAGTKAQEYLEVADRELRRVAAISSQTLQFHRQSTGARIVNCDDLFDSVLSIYQGRLVNAKIPVQRRRGLSCEVKCFDGEVRQVLNNLVSNAIDAMRVGEGQLFLRSRQGHDWKTGRRGVIVTVADTGAGIEAHALTHIFDPFFTTKGIVGTGLGLWISREIVDRHRGRLLVRTKREKGTVFTLFLPLDVEVGRAAAPVVVEVDEKKVLA